MKYEIFCCQTPTARLERILSIGSCDGYIEKERVKIYILRLYIKQIITNIDNPTPRHKNVLFCYCIL